MSQLLRYPRPWNLIPGSESLWAPHLGRGRSLCMLNKRQALHGQFPRVIVSS